MPLKRLASHYGIEFSSTPVLDPEFSNPLFLKTICEGLQSKGERRLPKGFRGISAVFGLYLEAMNKRLANNLDYDPQDNLVHLALLSIAAEMAETEVRSLKRTIAQDLVNNLLPNRGFINSLYQSLVAEGVLIEDRNRRTGEELTSIAYDRFADYAIANGLLQTRLDKDHPESTFAEGGGLAFLKDKESYIAPGLVEALSVLIPELTGKELIRYAPNLADHLGTGEAFLQSIVWRSLDAFSDDTNAVLDELIQSKRLWSNPLDTILSVSTIPEHPFNASFLHLRLLKDTMSERDSWWSTYLHSAWGTRGPVDQLVDWASGLSAQDDVEEAVVDLAATSLAWMLTTSNRFIRDRATKALVSLLTGRFESTERLVNQFSDINDLYVVERIYAVAYGVAMRSYDGKRIGKLASLVYQRMFASGAPPPHVLLRDYARGVIERALYLDADPDIDEQLIRPPYQSTWPDIPGEDLIDELNPKWDSETGEIRDSEWSRHSIRTSVMTFDFATYVIGINSLSRWLSLRLDEEQWRSPDERLQALLAKLSVSELQSWEAFEKAKEEHSIGRMIALRAMNSDVEIHGPSRSSSGAFTIGNDDTLEVARQRLMSELTTEHQAELARILSDNEDAAIRVGPRFDMRLVQRYVLWRVFDLGWTVDRFGQFDRHVSGLDRGRNANKPERIGKKYQWIAYHEMLAYLSDNYQYKPSYLISSGPSGVHGPWQEFVRDIDPSCTLLSTAGGTSWGPHSQSWWGQSEYTAWSEDNSHRDWVASREGLPDIEGLLRVSHPSDETRWVNAQGLLIWRQPHPAHLEPSDFDRRELIINLTGYLVRSDDVDGFMEWARITADFDRGLPDPPSISVLDSFLGEYGWAPAFTHQFDSDDADDGSRSRAGWPNFIRPVAAEYMSEVSGFDCSTEEGYYLRLPNQAIVERLALKWSGAGTDFLDRDGKLAVFDPTVRERGPTALLLREDLLGQYQTEEGLELCWVIRGEKWVIARDIGRIDFGSLNILGVYRYTSSGPQRVFLKIEHRRPRDDGK